MLNIHFSVKSDPADIAYLWSDYGAPQGSLFGILAAEIRVKRKGPIFVTAQWTRGEEKGTRHYTITPEMDGVETTHSK